MTNLLRRVVFQGATAASAVAMALAVGAHSQPTAGATDALQDLAAYQTGANNSPLIVHHWGG